MTIAASCRTLRENPYDIEAWYELGQALEASGAEVEAQECYSRVIRLGQLATTSGEAYYSMFAALATLPNWLGEVEALPPGPAR